MRGPERARAWIGAARLRTLPAAVAPVAVGVGCAHAAGAVAWGPAAAALLGALLIQIATNFANDVFDAEQGADTPDRKGPVRAVAAGLISARAMRAAMIATFALAVAVGGYLTSVAGWPIVAIGVASIAAGVLYTGGPWPLGYHGLGDVFVMIFFGQVAVAGTTYVALGRVTGLALALSVPVGALATAILVVNNLRDRATDVRVGKRTLAVRWGRGFALAEYRALLALAHAVPLALALTGRPLLAVGLATAPLAWVRARALAAAEPGPVMNTLLAATAQLLLLQSALITTALFVA
ncbi:MAG: 1,4-dihydroxy-2-naphthoate polyprenyltransferase [Myxococcales bacterium]|nr:1,4-dihydroxy-2-naphthoate polyprenyltransferase [Myxococcales bacterium]